MIRRSVVLAGTLAATVALTGTGRAVATPESAAEAPALQLIDQTFVVPGVLPGSELSITIAGDALGEAPCTTDTDEIRVVAYRPIATLDAFDEALQDPGAAVDDASYLLCNLERLPNGSIKLTIPTTIQAPTDTTVETLRLPTAGIIPIGVEVRRAGDVDGAFTTFVDRLATGTDSTTQVTDRMQVSVAFLVDGGPTLQPDGTHDITTADRAAVRAALDLIEQANGAPITLGVRPELVEGLSQSPADRATFEELATALAATNVSVLSLPYVAVDPSAAATSGAGSLFTEQLTEGENVFRELIPQVRLLRSLWMFDQPVSAEGAELLRDAGVQLGALLPPQRYSLSPSDRQFEIDYADGTLPATPVDSEIAELLADPGPDPTLAASHLAARVLLRRQQALDGFELPAPMPDHNMILSTPTGRIHDVATTARLIQLLAGSPELSLVPATSITSRSIQLAPGEPYRLAPEPADLPPLGPLAKQLTTARTDVDAVGSMLPPEDPRPAAWNKQLDVAASGMLGAEQRDAHLSAVRTSIDEIRDAIVPLRPSRFTLGGRRSTIRLTLTNNGPVDLKVRVIISSTKLDIDPEDANHEVTLPAGESIEEKVPVEARTNGEFPVDIQIVTPANDKVAVTEPVQLSARVNALTGLGQLATGAFVLVLLSWWVQHLRKRRRAAAASSTP